MDDERAQNDANEIGEIAADVVAAEEAAAGEPGLLERALRSAGSDAAKYLPVRFVPALTSLITVPVFTAAISPEQYGAFFLISSVASFGAALSTNWISSSLVRLYWPAKRDGRANEYTATLLWTAVGSLLATSAVALVAVWLAGDAVPQAVVRLVPYGIVYFVANFLTNVLVQVFRSAKRAGTFAKMQVGGVVLTTALSVAFVWVGRMGAAGILAGVALGWLIMLVPMLRGIAAEGSLSPRHVSRSMLSEFLTFGLPLIPAGVSAWALVLIDRFVIQAFGHAADVGLYSVAYSLGDRIMQMVTMPLLLTMSPSLIETFERKGQPLAEKVQTQFIRYFALATFPLIAGMAVAAKPFMHVFTSKAYWDAWPVLAVVSAGSMFASFAQIAGTGLALHKKTKLIMVQSLAAAAFNLVANILLVPRFGYYAAAFNTVAAYALLLVLAWFQSRPYMELRLPWGELGKIVAACAGTVAVVFVAFEWLVPRLNRLQMVWLLLAEVVVGVAVYAALLVAFRAVRPEERAFAVEIARRGLRRVGLAE